MNLRIKQQIYGAWLASKSKDKESFCDDWNITLHQLEKFIREGEAADAKR